MSKLACAIPLEWVQLEVEAQARAMTGAPWTRMLEPFVTKDLENDREAFDTFVKLREAPIREYVKGVEAGDVSSAEVAPPKLDADATNSVYQTFALRHASRVWCLSADKARRKAVFDARQLERLVTRQISNFS